jgi:photosystem II stability/assembly factor-like uncharacterized protein
MSSIVVAVSDDLLVLGGDGDRWEERGRHAGVRPWSLAADPERPERVWCGTGDGALLTTADGGGSWRVRQGPGGPRPIPAVAVGYGDPAPVFAGYDPSALYRSDDGGGTWRELSSMLELPSASTWSFPPRPDTHHVRFVLVDPHRHDTVYVAIEAGALLRSPDLGERWIDRVETGPYDTHTLRAHRRAPGRLYSAAGDGFMDAGKGVQQSRDAGDAWEAQPGDGFGKRNYGWGIAVDPGDPDTIVASLAPSPAAAHGLETAESALYRRSGDGGWQELSDGLPQPAGTLASALAASPSQPGVFYAGSNRGIYRSADAGRSWRRIDPDLVPPSERVVAILAVD